MSSTVQVGQETLREGEEICMTTTAYVWWERALIWLLEKTPMWFRLLLRWWPKGHDEHRKFIVTRVVSDTTITVGGAR